MASIAWVAVIVIVLVAIGLGWGVFFSGLVKGVSMVGQNPVVQNATHETAKFIANSGINGSPSPITVVPDKPVYKTAEPVVIIIKNQGNQTVTFPQSSAILKIKNQESGRIFTVTITQIKTELNPGETTTATWNQQDDSGAPVGTGTYVADVETTNSTSVGQTTFTVVNQYIVQNIVTVVQPVKTVYKTAEPVVIVIKNQGNQTVTFPQSSAILKIKNKESGKMFAVTITQIKTELNPGENETVTWNQQDDSGTPVGTGTYVADVETTNSTSVGQTTFTVVSQNIVTVVQTVKTVYKTTEPVIIVIKNQGNQTVTFPQSSAILKITNQASDKMFTITITQMKTELNPGENETVTWNQQDDNGAPVGTGTYVADVETTNSTSVGQTTFTVQ